MAQYSILTNNIEWLKDDEAVDKELYRGVKILAFCDRDTAGSLGQDRAEFKDARLLQIYPVDGSLPEITVIDGKYTEKEKSILFELNQINSSFNVEQYRIEHAPAGEDLMIEAGAGTGKTTVMIDRIMFLIHTVAELSFENIGMITFTNEATQNMKHKIQTTLLTRFNVTKSARYIKWLEDVSKLRVQTIHSFSADMITEIGSSIGYGSSVGLRSYKYEKKQLIHDALNEIYADGDDRVDKHLGAKLHELEEVIFNFWDKLENNGLTDDEILALDWGLPADDSSSALHHTLSRIFPELNKKYNELKMDNDAIAVGDIVRELRKILETGKDIISRSEPLKFLFVDEFQDSDNAQINTIAWIKEHSHLSLFAVGDVKQSIYRFRGAVDTAFDRLVKAIERAGYPRPTIYPLSNNYRTSFRVLDQLDPIFRKWETMGLLNYGISLKPQCRFGGQVDCHPVLNKKREIRALSLRVIKDALEDLQKHVEEEEEKNRQEGKTRNKKKDSTKHVTVLVRTNYQLQLVRQWCNEEKITCYIKKEGTLFSSAAALDLFSLIKAYVFPCSAKHRFDLLTSSFYPKTLDVQKLYSLRNNEAQVERYLTECLEEIGWDNYHKSLKLYPAVSVIQKIINEIDPTKKYVEARKFELLRGGEWEDDKLREQLEIDMLQYKADMAKLLENIRNHFSGQMSSLYQIYSYLKINVLTNTSDDEPDVSAAAGINCLYGMTVHKAKGLEFDTVIIPFTNREFRKDINTEILIAESQSIKDDSTLRKVGWSYVEWKDKWKRVVSDQKCNSFYQECVANEFKEVDQEEARLLYVAMTRAIRRLDCLVSSNTDDEHTWAHMLEV